MAKSESAPASAAASSDDPPVAKSKAEPTAGGGGNDEADNEDDMLLVTEFPPPPYYYALASRNTPSNMRLTPPEIPHRSFRVAAKRVLMERKKAREESEKIRLEAEGEIAADDGGGSEKNVEKKKADAADVASSSATIKKEEEDDDSIDPNDQDEPVVAVFGEIVEDPTLIVEEECHDPVEIRDNLKRLNREVVNGFLRLVDKLIHDPKDNKKLRDELSHNIFLMLQECNKFREHQAREILIGTLEQQLERRREGLALLREQIGEADEALAALRKFRQN